jgi:hypothetical protein
MYISPNSKTAKAIKRTVVWKDIAGAAREDSRYYGAGVYDVITILGTAAEKAWRRWNGKKWTGSLMSVA